MSTIKAGTLAPVRGGDSWHKHLKPFGKRAVNKAERKAGKHLYHNEF